MSKLPLYLRMRQPNRGTLGVVLSIVVGVLLYFVCVEWWKTWGAGSLFSFMYYIVFVLMWTWISLFYFQWWPFAKLRQPYKGLLCTVECFVIAAVMYLIFVTHLGWAQHVFNIASIWVLLAFILGPWIGSKTVVAVGGKQPLAGISGTAMVCGLSLVIWYFVPETFMGAARGFPFIWFLAGVIWALTFQTWPIATKDLGATVLLWCGYLAFSSFALLWILNVAGIGWYTKNVQALVWTLIMIAVLLFGDMLWQHWPVHRWKKLWAAGLFELGFWTIVSTVAYVLLSRWAATKGTAVAAGLPADQAFLWKVNAVLLAVISMTALYWGVWGVVEVPAAAPAVEPAPAASEPEVNEEVRLS